MPPRAPLVYPSRELGAYNVLGNKLASQTVRILIEVQSGSYLGEDDIVRFEDIYQRT
jgi:hypothetical protein